MEINRVLVSIKGGDVDVGAIELACNIAKSHKARVYALYVIVVQRALSIDARVTSEIEKADKVLERAEDIAREQDYSIEAEMLQSREIGPAVVNKAMERAVDLLIIGSSHRKRFGDFSLGSVAPYILKNAPCQVLLFRDVAKQL